MKIAVTTPTGTVGQHLVHHLLTAGVRPLLLLRDAGRLDADVREHCDVIELDQADADAVVSATVGVDALSWVTPSVESEDPLADYDRFARAVARAVRDNDIAHTVLQSSVGAELRHGAGEIDGLAGTELLLDEAVAGSGRAVTHLRCGYFFSNLLLDLDSLRSGTMPTVLPLDQSMPWVAPRDVAAVAALRLLAGGSGRTVQAVHGPVDLSWTEAMAIVSDGLGRPVEAARISDAEMRSALEGAGMSAAMVDAVLGMSTGLRDGFVPEEPRDVTTTTPTTLGSWVRDELVPALGG